MTLEERVLQLEERLRELEELHDEAVASLGTLEDALRLTCEALSLCLGTRNDKAASNTMLTFLDQWAVAYQFTRNDPPHLVQQFLTRYREAMEDAGLDVQAWAARVAASIPHHVPAAHLRLVKKQDEKADASTPLLGADEAPDK